MKPEVSIAINDVDDEVEGTRCLCLSVENAILLRDCLDHVLGCPVGEMVE